VWSTREGFSTVFGAADDVEATEELFTSLLVQATAAMQREGSKVDAAGRNRTKRFRRSFLLAFAFRISHRLREAAAAVVDDAVSEVGEAFLPVLAARDAAAEAAADDAFPHTRALKASPTDGEGWFKGRLFADRAELATTAQLDSKSA
jgi:hypothetical protein